MAKFKPVLVYDINGVFIKEFESSKAACIELGINPGGHLGEVARGERNMYKGYVFKYKSK